MYTPSEFEELKSLLLSFESLTSSIDNLIKPAQTITLTDLSIVQKEKANELAKVILKARKLGLDTHSLEAFHKNLESATLADLTKDYETIKSNLDVFNQTLIKALIESLSQSIKELFNLIKKIRDHAKGGEEIRGYVINLSLKYFNKIINNADFLNLNINELRKAKTALNDILKNKDFENIQEQVLDPLWQFGFNIKNPLRFVNTKSIASLDIMPLDLFRDFISKIDSVDLIKLSQASKELQKTTKDILKNNTRLSHGQCALILHDIVKNLVKSSDNYELKIAGAVLLAFIPGMGLGGMVGCVIGFVAFAISGQFVLSITIAAAILGTIGWITASVAETECIHRRELNSSTEYNIARLNDSIMYPEKFAGRLAPHFADTITDNDLNFISRKDLLKAFNKIDNEDHKRFIFEACLDANTNLGKRFLQENGFFAQRTGVEVRKKMQNYLDNSNSNSTKKADVDIVELEDQEIDTTANISRTS